MCPISIYMHMWDKRAREKQDNNKYIDWWLINAHVNDLHVSIGSASASALAYYTNAKNRLTMKHQGHIAAPPKYECTVMWPTPCRLCRITFSVGIFLACGVVVIVQTALGAYCDGCWPPWWSRSSCLISYIATASWKHPKISQEKEDETTGKDAVTHKQNFFKFCVKHCLGDPAGDFHFHFTWPWWH